MTTATATRTRRTPGLSAEQRRARQDELLATLADGVLELTTSDGWRRYLRAMATLRTYSTGNRPISEPREYALPSRGVNETKGAMTKGPFFGPRAASPGRPAEGWEVGTDRSPAGIRLWGLPGCHRPGIATPEKGSPR